MAVDFKTSETKDNLMRAFAGESQARTAIPLRRTRQSNRSCTSLRQYLPLPQIRRRSMRKSSTTIYPSLRERLSMWTADIR